jgi:hypothetical protein
MSNIRSTSGTPVSPPVSTGKGSGTGAQQVAPVNPTNPTGQQSTQGTVQTAQSGLTEGAQLAAVVTARATSGDTMLHTELGNFRMTSNHSIPVGSHVVLEVDAVTDIISARVTAINGEKLAAPPTVNLLPVINKADSQATAYVNNQHLPDKATLDSDMKRLTTALANSQATSSPGSKTFGSAVPTAQPTPPLTTAEKVQSQTNTAAFLATSLAGGKAPAVHNQSAYGGTAAYSHTTSPGPKSGGTPVVPTQVAAEQTTVNSAKVLSPEIVRATIDRSPIKLQMTVGNSNISLTSGNKVTLVVHGNNNASLAEAALASAKTGNQPIIGRVIGASGLRAAPGQPQNSVIFVQTDAIGTFRFTTTQAPQVGSQLAFSMTENANMFPVSTTMGPASIFKTPHLPLMSEWENLTEALNSLAARSPDLAREFLTTRIPSVGPNLGGSLLFFISALNGGNISKWMGQDFQQALEKSGKINLLQNLNEDFGNLARLSNETGGQDWKTLVFPFFNGEQLQQLRMFYRQHEGGTPTDDESETRFVIELNLSRTGPLQLDGLFKAKRFNLVLRTTDPLGDTLKSDIMAIFNGNLEITGISGGLTFRIANPFPLQPTEEWESNPPDMVVF